MAITQQELGRRIRAARQACRLTQEEVADRVGLSRPAAVQIEAGNRAVSSLELDAFARVFGRDIREFVADRFAEEDSLAALFRADPAIRDEPEVARTLEACLAVAREHMNLERLLGVERGPAVVPSYALPLPGTRGEAIRQGEAAAEEERGRLGLGESPLPDLAELLETEGVRTAVVDLPEDVSGLTLSHDRFGILVVANRMHHLLRRRFSFAHECAHVVLDRDRRGLVSRISQREELTEVRANAFAAAFLMPEDGVRQFVAGLGKGKPSRSRTELFDEAGSLIVEARAAPGSQVVQLYDLVQLACHFTVSRLSALYRLRNLRLVTEAQFEHLGRLDEGGAGRQLARQLGVPEPDHEELRNRFRHRFLTYALEAYRREAISYGKLLEQASMVGLDSDELLLLLEHAGLGDGP